MTTEVKLLKYNKDGRIGIILKHMRPASMKNKVYYVRLAAAKKMEQEIIVCVHMLSVLYPLSVLFDGSAQYILLELCTRWDITL